MLLHTYTIQQGQHYESYYIEYTHFMIMHAHNIIYNILMIIVI